MAKPNKFMEMLASRNQKRKAMKNKLTPLEIKEIKEVKEKVIKGDKIVKK